MSSSVALSPITEALPWHSLFHRKSRLLLSLLGSPSVPIGHWALHSATEAQTPGDTFCFSAGESACSPSPALRAGPGAGWAGGAGRGSWPRALLLCQLGGWAGQQPGLACRPSGDLCGAAGPLSSLLAPRPAGPLSPFVCLGEERGEERQRQILRPLASELGRKERSGGGRRG